MDTIPDPGAVTPAAKTVGLTREELYELVWTVPMQRLAERYGVSDVALAKTCRKLVIPVPPRGYWRRKETGRVPARPVLPRPRPGGRATVTLSLGRKREPPPPAPEVAARVAHEALPEKRILVADRLSRPHPVVREAAAVLRPSSPRVDPVRPWRIDPAWTSGSRRSTSAEPSGSSTPSSRRSMRGASSSASSPTTSAGIPRSSCTGRRSPSGSRRGPPPHPHVPTEAEKKDGSAGRRQWDRVPSGQLRLCIENPSLESARKTWSEGHRAKLDGLLNDFVVGLAVVADGLRARTLHWKRQREEEEEGRRQQALAEQRRKEEEQRVRTLEQQVDRWTRAAQVRAFADESERRATGKGVAAAPGTELAEWLAWARRHADRLDPFKPPPADTG